MIYAIRAVGTEFVKIGKAKNVAKRLADLDIGSPHQLEVIVAADWPNGQEKSAHLYLERLEVKPEWFKLGDEVMHVIRWMEQGEAGRQALIAACSQIRGGRADRKLTRKEQRKAWWKAHGRQTRDAQTLLHETRNSRANQGAHQE